MKTFFALLLAGAALTAAGQSCPTGRLPVIKFSGSGCPGTQSYLSPCAVGAPVTLTLVDATTGAPYALQSCETGITWNFSDGASVQTTATTVQHTYTSGGQFVPWVLIQSSQSQRTTSSYLLAATGTMTWSPSPVDPDVTAGDGTAKVSVHTTFAPTSVIYQVADYSNAAGRFTPATGTLTFAAGEFDKTITIPLIDDSLYQGDGMIGVTFTNPTNGVMLKDQFGYLAAGNGFTYINLLDNDPPPTLNWSSPKYSFSEGAGTATLTVVRTGDMTRTVGVSYAVLTGPYASGSLTFGPNETQKTITLPVPNDNVWTPNREWTVELQNPTNAAVLGRMNNAGNSDTTVTIVDDEPGPTISISDATVTEGNAGRTTVNLTLSLSFPISAICNANLTYSGTATPTIDYDAAPTVIPFAPGQTTQTIPITIIGDTEIEPNETIVVTIASVFSSFGAGPVLPNVPQIAKGTGTITILNDDVGMPGLTLAAGTSGRMTIYLGNPTAAPDTVTVTSSKPDVAKVPSSFVAQSGRSTLGFDVEGDSPGTSVITVKFPASLGGMTLIANVDVSAPAPGGVVVTQVAPLNGPTAGGTATTISGLNFTPSCIVSFGDTPATTSFDSATSLKVTTPAHAAGVTDLTVTCGTDQFTLPDGFRFFAPTRSRGVHH